MTASIEDQVRTIKRSRMWEARFVLMEDLLRDERELGRKEGEELGRKLGRDEGRKLGRDEGREEAFKRMSSLMKLLQENGRTDDMQRSWSDKAFREELFKEFNI